MRWAVSTMASSSSSENCWPRPAAVLDSTPAGGGDLDDVGAAPEPARAPPGGSRRRRSRPRPAAGACMTSSRKPLTSPWPPWTETAEPEAMMRGPGTSPRGDGRCAGRRPPRSSPPRSATVVKPAIRVAPGVARRRPWPGRPRYWVTSSRRPLGFCWLVMCTWLSIRPGRTKRSRRSTTSGLRRRSRRGFRGRGRSRSRGFDPG